MNIQNNIVEKAITTAITLHADQVRKTDAHTPYIVHPIEVGMIATRYVHDKNVVAAAILHDTLEDCAYTSEQLEQDFNKDVRVMVEALTENKTLPTWRDRKLENIDRLRKLQPAYFIKCADALANMHSLLRALHEEGASVWARFNATKIEKLAYFRLILQDSMEFMPKPMMEEYLSALKDLEYSELIEHSAEVGFKVES